MFLALHDGEVVGCAGLGLDPDEPTRAENSLTAVRRDWRGRGLAVHLKQRTLAWAADHGITEVYTWTQDGNGAMRTLNTRLGYATTRTGTSCARDAATRLTQPVHNGLTGLASARWVRLLRTSLVFATSLALALPLACQRRAVAGQGRLVSHRAPRGAVAARCARSCAGSTTPGTSSRHRAAGCSSPSATAPV